MLSTLSTSCTCIVKIRTINTCILNVLEKVSPVLIVLHQEICTEQGAGQRAFPTLVALEERCEKLEAFVQAAPDNQPDAQPA